MSTVADDGWLAAAALSRFADGLVSALPEGSAERRFAEAWRDAVEGRMLGMLALASGMVAGEGCRLLPVSGEVFRTAGGAESDPGREVAEFAGFKIGGTR